MPANPTAQAPRQPLYTFTYDAKSSKHDVSATGNINHAGIAEHRDRYKADHALVVAPGYSEGAMITRCQQQKIAPMTARDLGRLLDYTVQFGAIPVTKLREVLQIYNPKAVETWVTGLESWIRAQRPLTIDIFIKALELLRGKIPDALSASVISYACRETLQADCTAFAVDAIDRAETQILVNAYGLNNEFEHRRGIGQSKAAWRRCQADRGPYNAL